MGSIPSTYTMLYQSFLNKDGKLLFVKGKKKELM